MIFLQKVFAEERVIHSLHEDWMFVVVLIILGIWGYLQWNYPSKIRELFESVINSNKLREIMREELLATSTVSRLSLIASMLSLSLFGYLVIIDFRLIQDVRFQGFFLFFLILTSLSIIFTIKFLWMHTFQSLYNGDFTLSEYGFNVTLFLKLAGFIVLPAMLLVLYSNIFSTRTFLLFGLVLWSVTVAWRVFRGLFVAWSNQFSLFYIILYLCTFEILPTAVVLNAVLKS